MASRNDGFDAPGSPARIGPMDVQSKEFRVSRMGGYKMRDVDEFLDEVTASLTALIAENERLRAGAGAGPVVGAPDLDDVSRQADEIIARARDEAAQILADARAGAVTAAVMGGDDDRAAVNAFLVQEREFLQGLAALVQGHADSVKGMAKAARSSSKAPEAAGPAPADEPAEPGQAEKPVADAAVGTEPAVTPRAGAPAEAPATNQPASAADEGETIRIDDPQPAAASRGDAEPDGSLRELFWGEED